MCVCDAKVHGLSFNGFHVRFRDISRGGVRVIKSLPTTYKQNRATQFMENYNLAYTQHLKNKDIPEGGSKVGARGLRKGVAWCQRVKGGCGLECR